MTNYREMLHAIDSLTAFETLGIQADTNGAYVRCPSPSWCEIVTVFRDDAEIVRQVAANCKGFVRFIS